MNGPDPGKAAVSVRRSAGERPFHELQCEAAESAKRRFTNGAECTGSGPAGKGGEFCYGREKIWYNLIV